MAKRLDILQTVLCFLLVYICLILESIIIVNIVFYILCDLVTYLIIFVCLISIIE